MPRLLMLSVGAGAGHNRAAEALHAACESHFSALQSRWVDSLRYTSRIFKALYADSYLLMANHTPSLWGVLYRNMGRTPGHRRTEKLTRMYDRMAFGKLMNTVQKFSPDAVLCTHFLPAHILATRGCPLPVYVVVTDFDVHGYWFNRDAAGYFVANDEVRCQLERYGYPASKIRVTGIPIHPVFSTPAVRTRQRGELSGEPVVLFMSGGFGMGDMEEAVVRLLDLPVKFRLVVICGRNERLRRRLQDRVRSSRRRMTVLGYVTDMHERMRGADLAITKAGGLTVSECLATGLPMVILSPIPGQEEHNCDYLLERGAAVKVRRPDLLDYKVREVLEDPARLRRMRAAARSAAYPDAAREIVGSVAGGLR